jgi:hypothetical protein
LFISFEVESEAILLFSFSSSTDVISGDSFSLFIKKKNYKNKNKKKNNNNNNN